MSRASDFYPQLKNDRKRPRLAVYDGVPFTARCRIGMSRKFGILDRLRFLWTGQLWVITLNAKAHTAVLLATRKPTEQERIAAAKAVEEKNGDGER